MSRSAGPLQAMLPGGVGRIVRYVRSVPTRAFVRALRVPAARRGLRFLVDIAFDPFDPAFRADPYPFYHRLRARDPIHWSPLGIWVVTRYADAASLLTDARFGHPDYRTEARRARSHRAFRSYRSNSFIALNPPDHTRLRRFVGEVFTPALIADLRPRVQAAADRLLDGLEARGQMDVIERFVLPLPIAVISEVFGIAVEDGRRCQQWARLVGGASDLLPSVAAMARAEPAMVQLTGYFRSLIRDCRKRPRPGLVSALVEAQARHGGVDEDELLSSCLLLFIAGHETALAFLGTSIRTVLGHPGLCEALREDPAIAPQVVEELLRYEPPAQFFGRQAQEDLDFRGRRIRRGQTVFVVIGAVNRDPERFPDPDRVDFRRQDNHHLTFGHGIHACIGQGMARMQGQVALTTILRRFPRLRLGPTPPKWRESFILRALDGLHVAW